MMLSSLLPTRLLAGLMLTGVLFGCGGGASDTPDLGRVSGTVTLDGNPLANASVRFQPPDGRSARGVTDEQGRYTLQYNIGLMGAKIGPSDVFVSTATEGHTEVKPGSGDEGTWVEGAPETVPARYLKAGALTAEVKSGSNTIDFALESN